MNSFIGWVGGKSRLRKYIIPMIPADATRYIEVFGGAGWVLFGRDPQPGQLEVFNDFDGNLINLYRQIKDNCDELQREIDWIQIRELFLGYRDQIKGNFKIKMTDVQRAARFFYVVRCSFGSKRHSFATDVKGTYNVIQRLPEYKERLKNVVIDHLDFEPLIRTYDRPGAVFYADPPYVCQKNYYNVDFTEDDHRRLKAVLSNLKGRFILSYNDCDFIRNLYGGYSFVEINRKNFLSATGNNRQDYAELLITNF